MYRQQIKKQLDTLAFIVPQLQLTNLLPFLQIRLLQAHFIDECIDILYAEHYK